MMSGRVFEKVGVHVSTVFGTVPEGVRRADSGCRRGSPLPRHGISLIAHPWNPFIRRGT